MADEQNTPQQPQGQPAAQPQAPQGQTPPQPAAAEQPASGNRWEPQAGPAASEATAYPPQQTAAYPPYVPPAAEPVAKQRSLWIKRSVVGGTAAGIFVVGGLVGFLIGHATGDGDRGPRVVDFSNNGFPPGFGGDQDGDGQDGRQYGGPGGRFRPFGQNGDGQNGSGQNGSGQNGSGGSSQNDGSQPQAGGSQS